MTQAPRQRWSIQRRYRTAPVHWEWHTHNGVRYVELGIGHPTRHAWWAISVTRYLGPWARLLDRIPPTGYRSWGDTWAPLSPWHGGSRPWAHSPAHHHGRNHQS